MAEVPRHKGMFSQPGQLVHFPVDGSVISHDGTIACDTVVLQEDYPLLFATIGHAWTDPGKGDDTATEFRTPPPPSWSSDPGWEARIRF